jgi:hypothetical protein
MVKVVRWMGVRWLEGGGVRGPSLEGVDGPHGRVPCPARVLLAVLPHAGLLDNIPDEMFRSNSSLSSRISLFSIPDDPFFTERKDGRAILLGDIAEPRALGHDRVGGKEGIALIIRYRQGEDQAIIGFQAFVNPMKRQHHIMVTSSVMDPLDLEKVSGKYQSVELY